jgi:hypothetical protein
VTLTLFYAASLSYLLAYLESLSRRDLLLAALFNAFCAFTKNEGVALAILNFMILLCFSLFKFSRRKFADAGIFSGCWFVLSLPWAIWSKSLPRANENYLGKLSIAALTENASRLKTIGPEFLRQMFRWDHWGTLWVVLLIAAAATMICRRRREEAVGVLSQNVGLLTLAAALWILLLGQLGLYAMSFMLTSWDVRELSAVALDRLFLHATPTVIFLIGTHWAGFTSPNPERATG